MMYFRRGFFIGALLAVLFSVPFFVSGAFFTDNSQSAFANGTFARTFYNAAGGFVQLNVTQGFYNGSFTSRVFDAGAAAWGNISWVPGRAYGVELPGNNTRETQWLQGNVNMSGNVLLLHFNEPGGDPLFDSSGMGHKVNVKGVVYNSSGLFGTAFRFVSNNTSMDAPFVSVLNPRAAITLESWVLWSGDANQDSDLQNIITNGDPDRSLRITEPGHFTGGRQFLFYIRTGGTLRQLYSATRILNNTWYHVAGTYNGTAVNLYVNGRLENFTSSNGRIRSGTDNTYIGYEGSVDYFNGTLEELAIYNRSLNATELFDHYARGALRLNVTVRSCDDSLCVGDSFVDIADLPPQNLNITASRYFQYNVSFSTFNISNAPELYNLSIGYVTTNVAPQIGITFPVSGTLYSRTALGLNYTLSDTNGNLNACWYSTNGGVSNVSITCGTNVSLNALEGNNTWTVYANDTLGEINYSSVTFGVDSTAPQLVIVSPANSSNFSSSLVGINYTVSDAQSLSSCWWTRDAGATNTTLVCGTNITSSFSNGVNTVVVYANDSLNTANSSSVSFTVDTQSPSLVITSPQNVSYTAIQTQLNYSVSDVNLQSCWYTLTGGVTNTTILCGTNLTGLNSGQGSSTWTVYANDSLGGISTSSITFSVDSMAPLISITSPVSNANFSNATITITYSVNDSYLDSCWWTKDNGLTNTTITCGTNITSVFSEGLTSVTIYANDSSTNTNFSRISFRVDTNGPFVNLVKPGEGEAFGTNQSIFLGFGISDMGVGLESCWYTLTGGVTNVTLSGCQNTTFDVSGSGSYTLRLFANDTLGNIASDSHSFSVNLGAPAIQILSPLNSTYFTNGSITFRFNATDLDLEACELWGDFTGSFSLNQSNVTMNTSLGAATSFFLELTNRTYLWNIACNDTLGNRAVTGNLTFFVDPYAPIIALNAPTGTYTSLTSLPLTFSVVDQSPVSCSYNVSLVGFPALSTVLLSNCSSTTFDVGTFGNYVLQFAANDSAGNRTSTSTNFIVAQPSGGSSPGAAGGGGGGGGGGGLRNGLTGPAALTFSLNDPLIARKGFVSNYQLLVVNSGSRFLNRCSLAARGPLAAWFTSYGEHSLSSGQQASYDFSLDVPLDASSGMYNLTVEAVCNETDASVSTSVSVIASDFDFRFIRATRAAVDQLVIDYGLTEYTGTSQTVVINYTLLNRNDLSVAAGRESVVLQPNQALLSSFTIALPKDAFGEFSLITTVSNGHESFVFNQTIPLTSGALSGFAISGENMRTISIGALIILGIALLFFTTRHLYKQYHTVHYHSPRRTLIKLNSLDQ